MQHEHHRVPVTALAFWSQDVILSGEGTFLKAYDVDRKFLLAAVEVFEGQAIHGIIVAEQDESYVFIWGGQHGCHARVTRSLTGQLDIEVQSKLKVDDWILDAAFSDSASRVTRVALVTAHNALQMLPSNTLEGGQVEVLVPGSNCILYCAHIKWLSGSQCLIASGTAFGDVIVWSCLIQEIQGKLSAEHQIHYTFSAHEGSVFGVQLSSCAVAGRLSDRQRVLATCSDDRTIRLWDVSDLSVESLSLTEQQRQTGFGSVSSEDAHAPPALAKVMGHISRIWHVRFESSTDTGDSCILSFGEDASNICWAIKANTGKLNELPYSLEQAGVRRPHNGKNIWSLVISDSRIATGGADGAISLQDFLPLPNDGNATSTTGSTAEKSEKMTIFRAYAFLSPSEVFASSDKGSLCLVNLTHGETNHRTISDAVAGLRGYSVMASSHGIAFVAGSDGNVYMYRHDCRHVDVIARTGRKVAGLFIQQMPTESESIYLLVTNMGKSVASLYCMDKHGSHQETLEHCIPGGFVTTSFACARSKGRMYTFLGSRNGSIVVFDTTIKNENGHIPPALECTRAHAGETVTKIHATNHPINSDATYLLSTGRDGTYAVHLIMVSGPQPTFTTVHQVSLPFGPNIESLGFSEEKHLWIWGFRSTQFVVFDIQTQQEVMTVDCGGAHRIWSFQPNMNGGTFVWTKASKLHHQTQSRLPYEMINSGSHGREIKCAAVSPDDARLIATGAEDTDIKLSVFENGTFKCVHTLQKHNTGIQHLQWSSNGTYLFSSGGFEELIVWRITKNIPHVGIGMVCESQHPRSGTSDLRIMSFDVQEREESDEIHISTVYSDSTLKSWSYNASTRTWILLARGDYLTSCLTQCLHLRAPLSTPPNTISHLTASTDGHIALWNLTKANDDDVDALSWSLRHKIHQNAILALTSCNLPDQSRILITGGDDNAIGITRLGDDGSSCRILLVSRAHAAAVTALCVVAQHQEVNSGRDVVVLWLVSASIDQRVKLWRVEVDLGREGVEGVDVRLVRNVFTAVADVSSMEVMPLGDGKGVLVCGVGMDLWRIDETTLGVPVKVEDASSNP